MCAFRAPLLLLLACTLAGCTAIVHKTQLSAATEKKIAVFFDGTHNDIAADTNIKKLHSLVSLQGRRDIASIYIEGVGTKTDVLGMGTGFGVRPRVIMAYAYLLENYKGKQGKVQADTIYLFGFSRGAYQARILASLLNTVGIVAAPDGVDAYNVAELTYDAFKTDQNQPRSLAARREAVQNELAPAGITIGQDAVRVKVLGLWDSVEALGVPEYSGRLKEKFGIGEYPVDIDTPNLRYGDQLCNVDNAFHALSIDDNREWVFTPLLLTRKHLFADCPDAARFPHGQLAEVWFAGAHSDVGGGYEDSLLSGVSMNWMIEQLREFNLLPDGAAVPEDPYGSSHDPEASMLWGMLYHAKSRDIGRYVLDSERHLLPATLCVHKSVFERRRRIAPKAHENNLLQLLGPTPNLTVHRVPRKPVGWAWTDTPGSLPVDKTGVIKVELWDKNCSKVAP